MVTNESIRAAWSQLSGRLLSTTTKNLFELLGSDQLNTVLLKLQADSAETVAAQNNRGSIGLIISPSGVPAPINPETGNAFNNLSNLVIWVKGNRWRCDAVITVTVQPGIYLEPDDIDLTGCPPLIINGDAPTVSENSAAGTTVATAISGFLSLYQLEIPIQNPSSFAVDDLVTVQPNTTNAVDLDEPEGWACGLHRVLVVGGSSITVERASSSTETLNSFGVTQTGTIAVDNLKIFRHDTIFRFAVGKKLTAKQNILSFSNVTFQAEGDASSTLTGFLVSLVSCSVTFSNLGVRSSADQTDPSTNTPLDALEMVNCVVDAPANASFYSAIDGVSDLVCLKIDLSPSQQSSLSNIIANTGYLILRMGITSLISCVLSSFTAAERITLSSCISVGTEAFGCSLTGSMTVLLSKIATAKVLAFRASLVDLVFSTVNTPEYEAQQGSTIHRQSVTEVQTPTFSPLQNTVGNVNSFIS